MARRRVALAVVALALAACKLDPAGRCDVRADCGFGLDCLQGVCAACRGDFDCGAWQACGGDGLCAAAVGKCDSDAGCPSWERCAADHACALREDHCDATHLCLAPQTCDPAHHCSLPPGKCDLAAVPPVPCPAWMGGCVAGACSFSATPGDDVLAWGTLDTSPPYRFAAARVTAPDSVDVGFDAGSGSDGRGFVDPVTGSVIYRHEGDPGGPTLRRSHRDGAAPHPLTSDWTYPLAPSEDDAVAIDAAACPDTWGRDRWLVQGGTGALLYGCPLGGGALWDLHVAAGAAFGAVKEPLAWSGNDRLLALDAGGALRVLDPAGGGSATAVPVHDGPVLASRTTAAGFLLALSCVADGKDELWEIDDATRGATLLGAYPSPAPDPGAYPGLAWEVMDSDGTLYGRAFPSLDGVVLQRTLAFGATKIYDAQSAPLLVLGPGSFLLTRP